MIWKEASKALRGLRKIKVHCSVLAIESLRLAIENYEEHRGLVKEKKPTTVETMRKCLKKVMNPLTRLDLVRTNLVQDTKVKDGTVRVIVNLPPDH